MNDSFDIELTRRLASLEADTRASRLPGAAAARHRAAQRTRQQVTGVALTGVAAVAVSVLALGPDAFSSAPSPQPAETPTTNATAAPTAALMGEEELPGTEEIQWRETEDPAEPFQCAPPARDGTTQRHYVNDDGGRFDQFIESSSDAERRMEQLRTTIEQCVAEAAQSDDRVSLIESWNVDGLGDEGWMASYWAPMTEPGEFTDMNAVEVRLVRRDEYVSVVVHGGPAQDANLAMSPDTSATAGARLCEAIGDECAGEPDPQQLHPSGVGDLPGWLTADDVVDATGLEQLTQGSEPRPADGWNMAGLPLDPIEAGARAVDTRSYADPRSPEAIAVDETIARFPGEAAARAHYDELVAAADAFEQEGDVITTTGTVEGDGYVGTAWRSENAQFDTVFVYGAVTRGDAVAVVAHSINGFENRDVTAEQMHQLLDRAGQRLGG